MKHVKYALLLLAFGIAAVGCTRSEKSNTQETLNVVATTGMIADAASNIGGEFVEVTALMGPGVDPHLYRASEGDVSRISGADIVLFNGLHLEAKLSEVLERLEGRVHTVGVANLLDESRLIRAEIAGSTHDPHVWFDVALWLDVVENVYVALRDTDPDRAANYEESYAAYRNELVELDRFVKERVSELEPEQRVLVTAHDAFGYFGRAYGFEVLGLQGISTVSEAGASDLRSLADLIASRKIRAIFVETSVSRKNIEALQKAVASRGFEVAIGGEL